MPQRHLQLPDDVTALQEMGANASASLRRAAETARDDDRAAARTDPHSALGALGASSEKVSDAQLGLFNEAEATPESEDEAPNAEIDVPAHRRAQPKRKPLPAEFERVVVIHDLAEEDKVCPHDGTPLVRMSETMWEHSEQFEIIPVQFRVLQHQRLKYRCPCCESHIKTAPMTPHRYRRAWRVRGCWRTSRQRSLSMHCRCTARWRSSSASVFRCLARPWQAG